LLMLPGGGDELQGIKKGILELADAVVVNKADGESENQANLTRQQYAGAMSILQHSSFWTPQVVTCSALKLLNIDSVWEMIEDYHAQALDGDAFLVKRRLQNSDWMHQLVNEMLQLKLAQNDQVAALMPGLKLEVENQTLTPYAAAKKVMEQF
jgi:LAO/AO transport system kinase